MLFRSGGGGVAAASPTTPADLPSYPPLGTALPVALLLGPGAPAPPLPPAGAWVRLDKLAGAVVGGQLQALLLESSHWGRAPPAAAAAVAEAATGRLADGDMAAWAPADPGALVAAPARGGPAERAPRVTLRVATGAAPRATTSKAAATASSSDPATFRSLVRIIGTVPPPDGAAGACVRGGGRLWEFRVSLLLEDGTGRATALATGPDGGGLFAGVEPRDLTAAPSAAAALRGRLAALVGGEGGQGAWAEVGLRPDRKRGAAGAGVGGLRVVGTQAAAVPVGGRR